MSSGTNIRADIRSLLTDESSSEDEFSGGGHDRTADTLACLLNDSRMAGKTIGLEGGWGSGKSSVVRMAASKLLSLQETSKNHQFFTFSLWRTHTKNIKREFLAELLEFVRNNQQIPDKKYETLRDGIRGRSRTVRTTNHTRLTLIGVLTLALIPLAPIVMNWLDVFQFGADGGSVGLLGALLPINVFNTLLLIVYLVGYLGLAGFIVRNGLKGAPLTQNLDFLESKTDEDTTTEYIVERDAAQYEFADIFKEVVAYAEFPSTHLIIVLDDIDRVDPAIAYSIWSVAREIANTAAEVIVGPGIRTPTTIIPFDREHLRQCAALWKTGGTDNTANVDQFRVAESLIEKTFLTTLKVPPPILSDWKSYFDRQFGRVFASEPNDTGEGTRYHCYRTYEWLVDHRGETTPRSIKMFLNDVATLKLQWKTEIDLETIAAYVASRRYLGEGGLVLPQMDNRFVGLTSRIPSTDWQQQFAALDYNVKPDLAVQVVIEGALRDALGQGQNEEVKRYANYQGFTEHLVRQFDKAVDRMRADDPQKLARIGLLIREIDVKDEEAAALWRSYGRALEGIGSFQIVNDGDAESLKLALRNVPISIVLPALKRIVRSSVDGFQVENQDALDEETGANWADAIAGLVQESRKRVPDKAFDLVLPIEVRDLPVSVQAGMVANISNSTDPVIRNISRQLDTSKAIEHLTTMLPMSGPIWQLASAVELLDNCLSSADVNLLAQELSAQLSSASDDIPALEAGEALTTLVVATGLRYKERGVGSDASDALEALAADGSLLYWLNIGAENIQNSDDSDGTLEHGNRLVASVVSAMCLTGRSNLDQLGYQHPSRGDLSSLRTSLSWLNSDGVPDDLAPMIAGLITKTRQFGLLLKAATKSSEVHWVWQVMNAVGNAQNVGSTLVTQSVIPALPDIIEHLNSDDFDQLLRALDSYSGFIMKHVKKAPFAVNGAVLSALYQLPKNGLATKILSTVTTSLKGLSADQLGKLINGSASRELEQLRVILLHEPITFPSRKFRDGIQSTALMWLRGEAVPDDVRRGWKEIIQLVQKNYHSPLFNDLAAELGAQAVSPNSVVGFLDMTPEFLASVDRTTHSKTLIEKLFRHLIEIKSEQAMRVLNRDASDWKDVFLKSEDGEKMLVSQLLNDNAHGAEGSVRKTLDNFMDSLGLRQQVVTDDEK